MPSPSPHSHWSHDPDATVRIPVVGPRATALREPWQPIPADQTPERRRLIFRGAAAFVGFLAALIVVAGLTGSSGGTGTTTATTGSTTPLGCQAQPGQFVVNNTCAQSAAISRLCLGDATDVYEEYGLGTTTFVREFGSDGVGVGQIRFDFTNDRFTGVHVTCEIPNRPGVNGVTIAPSVWMAMMSPGPESSLPSYLR